MKTWASFEEKVRSVAQNIWNKGCSPKRVGGVNLDGVVEINPGYHVFIEMTEERNLGKVRDDVTKLVSAKSSAFAAGIISVSYCVVNGIPTQAMKEAGVNQHITVLSFEDFRRLFFDYGLYSSARTTAAFGSSVHPLTGEPDDTEYVPVNYLIENSKKEVTSGEIASYLTSGRHVILLGEYGTGKSRCVREVFKTLSRNPDNDLLYPLAIDLRQCWGLTRANEIIRRHIAELGIDNLDNQAIRAFNRKSLILLLDGFDEIGSQSWSNDGQQLRRIRTRSLQGVSDIVSSSGNGVLVCGREHYFSSRDEMFEALGLKAENTIVLRSKDEFSDTELLEYFNSRDISVDLPEWLPRRPLICQTISDLEKTQLTSMFDEVSGEIDFWNHFIDILCQRDALIHPSFTADTILKIYVHLAHLTRMKSANVGPISLVELQGAFQAITGSAPVEEASVLLQRLPSLGRLNTESNDRQFVDMYILDGLRAKDVVRSCTAGEPEFTKMASAAWINPLGDLGQRVLAKEKSLSETGRLSLITKISASGNKVLACDLIASLTRGGEGTINFNNLSIADSEFIYLTFAEREIKNLHIRECYVGELVFPVKQVTGSSMTDCVAKRVVGVSSLSGLPNWIAKLDAQELASVQSVSRIRQIGLKSSHEILTTIVRKTFFQKGAGRKEESLFRGLGNKTARALTFKILNMLIGENLITTHMGDEGLIYSPVRSETGRMQKMLDELTISSDPAWVQAGELD